MAFVKEVCVTVKSVIQNLDGGIPYGEDEVTEAIVFGFMRPTDTGFFLTYSENGEGGRTVSDVTVDGERVTVRRHGSVESEMVFEVGTSHSSIYEVPPYRFDMKVSATKIRNTLALGSGGLDLFYKMELGGAEKKVRLRLFVHPKEG
jgi:uncharacterized beta-barrel protein YwiB (DUF1934 family)